VNTIVVAIGANLPGPAGASPLETCCWAADQLRTLPGLELRATSRWYRTPPDPPAPQPDYVNGAVRLEGDIAPETLLAALHAIEARAGRHRTVANAARPLDLDLVAMDQLVRETAPILPHPRMHLRSFVLAPVADVAPLWRHPLTGLTAPAMLSSLGRPNLAPQHGTA